MPSTAKTSWIKRGAIATGLVAVFATAAPLVSTMVRPAPGKDLLTHRVSRGDLVITVTADGTLESSENIEIKCKVKGGSTVLWVIEPGTLVSPGDVLVELDKSRIEDNITQQQISYESALANQIISRSEVEVAKTSITEYLEGTFQEEKATIEKEIFDAEEAVRAALLAYESAQRLAAKGMVGSLQLESREFAVESARKDLELKQRRLEALENCTIRSPGTGLVILPSMAEWKQTPDIEEGATVHEEQTLLMIPDLNQMQVKVGIHEAKVDRLRVGMPAKVQLQGMTLIGAVDAIAEVTRPAGWWTGNLVKYDTIVKLEARPGLKPGMSAIVDVVLDEHHDVLTVPVACIVEAPEGFLVWVKTPAGVEKRRVALGDTNDEFTIVTAGLTEGEEVVLNPTAFLDEAQSQALRTGRPEASGTEESPPPGNGRKGAGAPPAPKPKQAGKDR